MYHVYFFPSKRETKVHNPEFWLCFLVETRVPSSLISFQCINKKPTDRTPLFSFKKRKRRDHIMGGKDDQEGNNDSGSDDDIAFADDDNDTKDEETNVESYDSDDEENLEGVSFMLCIFLYRHRFG